MGAAVLLNVLAPMSVWGELVEGFAEPYRLIEIAAASETGLITSIGVREGQTVKRGDLLATLDIDVLVATLNIAKERSRLTGRFDGANAELEMRRRRLAKLQQLLREGHATEGEVERAQTDVVIAQANVLLADEERRLAALECKRIEAQIQRRQVRSPIDGVVTEIRREVGEAVAINDPHLMTVVQLNPLRVKFSLTMAQASELHEGQILPLHLSDVSHAADATVEIISPVLDAKSGTVQVTCVIDNSDNRYRSGMRCVVRLPDGDRQPYHSSSSSPHYPN
jgi:RND family efflux transporter MFP subunit